MKTKRHVLPILFFLLLTSPFASGETLRFGAGLGWDGTVSAGLRETDGWRGEAALTLAPLGRNPFLTADAPLEGDIAAGDIDLLLLAEPGGLENPVGHYRVEGDYEISSRFTARGEVSFRPGAGGLALYPSARSMWAPGSEWGDFTLDFRLRPATLRNGAVFFEWRGRGSDGTLQSVTARVENRRLVWEFRGFFRQGTDRALNLTLVSTPLIPGEWRHHRIRYNSGDGGSDRSGASPGLLEYLVDGVPADMVHATRDGREGPEPYSPRIGDLSDEPMRLAPAFAGYIDEFRLAPAFASAPPAGGYADRETSASGVGRTLPVDGLYPGSRLTSVRVRVDAPGSTRVRFFARSAAGPDDLSGIGMPDPADPDWMELDMAVESEDPTGFGRWYAWNGGNTPTGRYFSVGYILEPDPGADLAPVLSALEMTWDPRLPPRIPRDLRWSRDDAGRVRLSWSPDAEDGVAGWWISWGPRPGDYAVTNEEDDVRGSAWIPRNPADRMTRPEYIWPEMPENRIVYMSLRAAWTEGAPQPGGSTPGDYRALSEPTGEMNFRP